jgi:hypothetical protein
VSDYEEISQIFHYQSHYFCEVKEFKTLRDEKKRIEKVVNNKHINEGQIISDKQIFNDKVRHLLRRELSKISKQIDSICK